MKISARSVLMAGVATVTASAVAIAPSVQPPPPPARRSNSRQQSSRWRKPVPPTTLSSWAAADPDTAKLRHAAATADADPFPLRRFSSASHRRESTSPSSPGFTTGSRSASTWFGWIPYVGWLAPQIWPSATTSSKALSEASSSTSPTGFDGNGSFGQGLVNFGVDTVNSHSSLSESTNGTSGCRRCRHSAAAADRLLHVRLAATTRWARRRRRGRSRECRQPGRPCSTAFSTTPSTPTETSTGLSRAALR